MVPKFTLIGCMLLFFLGCDESYCLRKMEIQPGLTWEYYSLRHSKVVSDKYGTLLDGEIYMTFHEFGFDFSGGGKFVYVDVVRNLLDDSVETQIRLISGKKFGTYDASSAIGVFTKDSHKGYLAEMESLKKRLEAKGLVPCGERNGVQ